MGGQNTTLVYLSSLDRRFMVTNSSNFDVNRTKTS